MNYPSSNANAVIQDVGIDDIEAIVLVYSHHVLHGTATFEIEPPNATELNRRRETVWPMAFRTL